MSPFFECIIIWINKFIGNSLASPTWRLSFSKECRYDLDRPPWPDILQLQQFPRLLEAQDIAWRNSLPPSLQNLREICWRIGKIDIDCEVKILSQHVSIAHWPSCASTGSGTSKLQWLAKWNPNLRQESHFVNARNFRISLKLRETTRRNSTVGTSERDAANCCMNFPEQNGWGQDGPSANHHHHLSYASNNQMCPCTGNVRRFRGPRPFPFVPGSTCFTAPCSAQRGPIGRRPCRCFCHLVRGVAEYEQKANDKEQY